MELCVVCDGVALLEEMATSRGNRGIEIVDGCKVHVDKRLIDERPKALGGLELRTAGRLIDEPDAVGNRQIFRAVPTGIVEL